MLFAQAGPGDKIPSIIVDDGFGPIAEVDIAERCAGQRVILLGSSGEASSVFRAAAAGCQHLAFLRAHVVRVGA